MLTLVTGVPGAGKTLNTIAEVFDRTQVGGEWADRVIYAANVDGLNVPGWEVLGDEDVPFWYELPNGAVVIVDEAQSFFPQRGPKDAVPRHVERLSLHRHQGQDVYLVTQHPKLLDVSARRMVGRHLHFDRKFNGPVTSRWEWNRCVDDPNDFHARKEGVRTSVRLRKDVFSLYKSAEIHTHKFRLPKKVVLALGFMLAIPVVAYVVFSAVGLLGSDDVDLAVGVPRDVSDVFGEAGAVVSPGLDQGVVPGTDVRVARARPDALPEWLDMAPRVQGLPHTAPAYDELRRPESFPRPQCMMWERKAVITCRCGTQQGTWLAIEPKVCFAIVRRGYFDPTRPDGGTRVNGSGDASSRPKGGASSLPSSS